MSRNGSGVYTLPSNSWNPAVANTQINATDWNSSATDLSTAITQSIAYDGQTTCVGSIPFAQGIITSNTGLKVKDTGGTYTLAFTPGSTFSANRVITWKPNNANRTIDLAGNLTLAGSLTSSGAYPITLTATAATSVTLPTSGTLATTAGTVASITGTANEITASAATGAVTLSLPTALTFTGKTITGGTFASPALTTPTLGVASGTSLALGGATIGTDALGVTGTFTVTGPSGSATQGTFTSARAGLSTWNFNNTDVGSGSVSLHLGSLYSLDIKANSPGGEVGVYAGATGTLKLNGGGNINIDTASSAGTITLASLVTTSKAVTMSAALTYGGVTLSNAVTGTGNMVLSTSPTFTGTITAAAANYSGLLSASATSLSAALQIKNASLSGKNWDFIPQTNSGDTDLLFYYEGTGAGTKAVLSKDGAWQWNAYGAGAITSDSSGNLTSVSDETLKDIQRDFTATVDGIKPIVYKWKKESGMETEHEYAGFSAQNCQAADPLMVGKRGDGKLTLQDRAVLAAVVNSIHQLNERLSRAGIS